MKQIKNPLWTYQIEIEGTKKPFTNHDLKAWLESILSSYGDFKIYRIISLGKFEVKKG